jgi:hypothetical protein
MYLKKNPRKKRRKKIFVQGFFLAKCPTYQLGMPKTQCLIVSGILIIASHC